MRPALTIPMMAGSNRLVGQIFCPGFGPPAAPHHAFVLSAIKGLQAQNLVFDCAATVHFVASEGAVPVGVFSVKLPFNIAWLGTIGLKTLSEMKRKPAYEKKKNSLSCSTGPPSVPPRRC